MASTSRPLIISLLPQGSIPGPALNVIAETGELWCWEESTVIPYDELVRRIAAAAALIVIPDVDVDGALLDHAAQLRVVSTASTGTDRIDLAAATERGILVCHTPGLNAETVADHTVALMLAVARRLPEMLDLYAQGQFLNVHFDRIYGRSLHGASLGLVGLGTIGAAVARRARGFAMTVRYTGRSRKPELEQTLGLEWSELDDLLAHSDVISLHCALTPETRGLIGARELALMRPTAMLINTARGPLIDTGALVTALQQGKLFGAGLDVTEPEPLPLDHPLVHMPNVIVTPHSGYASFESWDAMITMAVANLADGLNRRRPLHLANPAAWERFNGSQA